MELKEKLIKLRREKGWTQDELARELDVTRQAVSKWERGAMAPSTVNLIALGRLYGIPLDELANGKTPPEEPPGANVAAADPPDPAPTGQRPGLLRLAGAAALAVILLLSAVASVITIWTAVSNKSENSKKEIIQLEDLDSEYIDPAEIIDLTKGRPAIP